MTAVENCVEPNRARAIVERVDHLVYGTPDLQVGIDRIEQLVGVRATPGGQHPGGGTRNALIALGPAMYLEIIGPDPEQPAPAEPRTFGIDDVSAPRLVAWAAKGTNLETLVENARLEEVPLGVVSEGTRRTPAGGLLVWRYTSPRVILADGLVPFFIDWGATTHPARSAAQGARLVAVRAEHPDPSRARGMLATLGLDLAVAPGPRPALIATIDGPRGRVELR
jgi:Glyoxalase-like domain